MSDPSINWEKPQDRALAVQRMKQAETRELQKARQIALQRGKPFREKTLGGGVRELVGLDEDGELLYVETKNANAAISTGVNLVRDVYSVDGLNLTVGVWDADSALVTHREFNETGSSRINNMNAQPTDDHATHVAGTIAAYGVSASAKGMAYKATIDSYDWTNDDSEMTAAGATAPGQFGSKLYLSNHSYGFAYGWRFSSTNGRWEFYGTGSDENAYDPKFGRYSAVSYNMDTIIYNAPYYLFFWAAGNENTDGPNNGNTAYIQALGTTVTYNSSIHPQNDGDYRNGFETVADESAAKNLVVVGAANDAVTSGQRDPSKATIVSFSSTGPTDDGRIKPDVVANGASLYSPVDTGDANYGSKSGTSMASPNACGSAAVLVDLYRDLFGSNAAMRASTLKGLLIHTATDRGNPGPDYTYGWGLINVKEAADLLNDIVSYPDKLSLVEDEVSTSTTTKTYNFFWDGSSSIRTTLCWTDPAGTSQSGHDIRTPALVNDLNLKLIAPDGTTEYFPFVMPFVGTWTVASMSQNATTGVNHVDNVEQVLIENPGQSGEWTIEVTYAGSLTNNTQQYGLVVSGSDSTPAGLIVFANNGSFSVSENGSSATITVDRVNGTVGAVSVDYATSNGSATVGADYTAASGTLSWADGDGTSRTFTVPILNDSVDEISAESVIITLSNPSGTTISGTNPATLTINDDDNAAPAVNAGLDETVYLTGDTWTPTQISTALWYDASDAGTITAISGAVSQWNDKSVNGNHLSQTNETDKPTTGTQTIGGVNALVFADDFMQSATSVSTVRAAFFVTDSLAGSSTNTNVAPIFGETTANISYTFVRTNATDYSISIDGNNGMTGAASVFGNTLTTGTNINLGVTNAQEEAPMLWYTQYDSAVTLDYLGHCTSNEAFKLQGNIGEFIVLDYVPSVGDRQKIEGYLAWKWGLEASLPLDHPHKSADPSALVATANLDGTVTDSAGDLAAMNTLWTLVSGPVGATVVFGDETAIDTTVTFTEQGIYTLRLTANDGEGPISSDVIITVNEAGMSLAIDQAAISENGGTSNAILTRQETVGELVVTLSSSDETEATVPSTVTILDGQATASFTVTAQNDAILDGTQTVTITATASGVPDRTDTIEITDSESTVTYDGNGSTTGTPPTDGNAYEVGASVTVLGKNTLSNEPYLFNGWNTAADGSGTTYPQGSTLTISADTTLYAMWVPGPVAIYEPFDDLDSTLNGNTPGVGLSGTWSGSALVVDGSLSYGSLPTSGGRVVTNSGTNFPNGYISPGTTLSDAGLMADGATMWFSVLIVNHADVDGSGTTDNRTYVSFGTGVPDGFDRIGGNDGSGFTIAVSKVSEYGITAQTWNDGSDAAGGATRGSTAAGTAGSTFLAVGKITWGEFGVTDDVFELYLPGTDLAKPASPISTIAADFDQLGTTATWSTAEANLFDTIGIAGGRSPNNVPEVDEFRFGSTYESVTGQGSTALSVTYNGNGNDGGTVPTDSTEYVSSDTVTVLGNTGSLTRTGYAFIGWNTASGGGGTGYVADDSFTITEDVTLYAQWQLNVAPVADDQTINTVQDTAVAITLTASDADNDELSYTVVTQPGNGSLSGTAPALTYTPGVGYTGSDSFTFTVNDGTVDSNTATVSITVLTPFEDWAGVGESPAVDNNGDGVADGMAWVLGASDPVSDASSLQPVSDTISDPGYYIFTYRRSDEANNDSGTSIDVVYGDNMDMVTWGAAVHDGSNIIITETDDHYGPGVDRVEVKINLDLATNGKIFTRLRVTITP